MDCAFARIHQIYAYGYGFATVGFSRRALYLDDTGKRLGHKPGYATNGHCVMYGKTNDSMFAGYEAEMQQKAVQQMPVEENPEEQAALPEIQE